MFLVLLIDDDENDVYLLRVALEKTSLPVTVIPLSNGNSAIEHFTRCEHVPDLVLLDLKMPDVSGFQILAWLKRHPRFACVPVTVLTCSDDPEDKQKAAALGASGYVDKTPQFENAVAAINAALAARRTSFTQSPQISTSASPQTRLPATRRL